MTRIEFSEVTFVHIRNTIDTFNGTQHDCSSSSNIRSVVCICAQQWIDCNCRTFQFIVASEAAKNARLDLLAGCACVCALCILNVCSPPLSSLQTRVTQLDEFNLIVVFCAVGLKIWLSAWLVVGHTTWARQLVYMQSIGIAGSAFYCTRMPVHMIKNLLLRALSRRMSVAPTQPFHIRTAMGVASIPLSNYPILCLFVDGRDAYSQVPPMNGSSATQFPFTFIRLTLHVFIRIKMQTSSIRGKKIGFEWNCVDYK